MSADESTSDTASVTEQSEMQNLVKIQNDLLTYVNGILSNFEKTADVRRTKSYFNLKITQCQQSYEQFFETHKRILCSNLDTKHEYFVKQTALVFEDAYVITYSIIQEAKEEKFPPAVPIAEANRAAHVAQRNYSSVQLPNIAMPIFSGKHIDWPSFHDAFSRLVHQNLELNAVQKFNFLKQALPSNRDLDIHDMPLTDDNYATAWDLLVKRYNNPRILYMHHLNTLYSIQVLTKERAEDIKSLLNVANVCITAFRRLDIPIDRCDHWIAHFIATRLPKETHHDWEHHWGSSNTIPKFSDLEKFLNDRLFTLDAIENRNSIHPIITTKVNDSHKPANANDSKTMKRKHYSERKSFHTTTALRNNDNNENCPVCNGTHIIRKCQTFLSKDCFERKSLVDKHRLCLNCLSGQHLMAQCSSAQNCRQCGLRHHTLLHFPVNPSNNASGSSGFAANRTVSGKPATNQASISSHASEIHTHHTNVFPPANHHTPKRVLLATALISVENMKTGKIVVLRALIDDCSEGTIITEHGAQVLGLRRTQAITDVTGVGQNASSSSNEIVNFALRSNLHPEFKAFVDLAVVMKIITTDLPSHNVIPQDWPHIEGLTLADPTYFRPNKIDLLIGSGMSASIYLPDARIGRSDHPIARNTYFGWVLHGQTATIKPTANKSITMRSHHIAVDYQQTDLTSLFHDFIETEKVPEERMHTEEEKWFLDFFSQTYQRQSNGKYMVRLPFKSHSLGRSHQIAVNWFHRLERRFNRVNGLRERYKAGIDEYFQLNQIIPAPFPEQSYVTCDENGNTIVNACVLPHHAVFKEDSLTTKTRIVYNAAAKTSNGRSLNDNLSIGPKLQSELPAVILNWRLYEFVFTSDIQRMYRCIDMHPDDIQYQRILWRNETGELQTYCLNTVTFGTSPAPCLAIRVMHQIAEDEKGNFPLAEPILKNEMYVDDVQSGGHSIEEAVGKRDQLIGALKSAGMELRKWCSNHPLILSSIPIEHQSLNSPLEFNVVDTVKTLGMCWQPGIDQFTFNIRFELPTKATKRSVLSTTARLYDPLGYITPVIVVAKIILKRIWGHQPTSPENETHNNLHNLKTLTSLAWDDVLPDSLKSSWDEFLATLPDIKKIAIPRWIDFSPSHLQSVQLHAFCDGATPAYAANVYIRLEYSNATVCSHLLIAKGKVTPTKPLTIPRVELCGAELTTRLASWVRKNLRISIDKIPIFFWCDATIVLFWIHGDISRWKTYVANRISKILSLSSPRQWSHVNTDENPADCATRGLTPTQLANFDLWWKGPKWLVQSPCQWPTFNSHGVTFDDETAEVKSKTIHVHVSIRKESIVFMYSSLFKLIRVNAWIRRFHHNSLNKSSRLQGPLSVTEIQASTFQLIRLVQAEAFGKEINCILAKEPLPKKCKISGLAPFLDEHNILRVWGRLQRSNLPYRQRHPIILPHTHHFTHLVIADAHSSTLHGGTQLTLTTIRGWY